MPKKSANDKAYNHLEANVLKKSLYEKRPLSLLFIGVVLISVSPILVKLSQSSALQVGFYRNAFGALFLLPLVLVKKEKWFHGKWTVLFPVIAGALFFLDLWGWHAAIGFVGPGIATLLGNCQVFFLALFGILFLGEKLSRLFLFSVPLALFGIFLIVRTQGEMGDGYLIGVLLALSAAFCYAVFLLIMRKSQSLERKISADMNLLYITISTGVLFGITMALTNSSFQLESQQAVFSLLAYGLFPHVIGWIIISRCLPLVRASVAGITLLLQPVLTFTWEILVFQAQFHWLQLLGGAIAIVAIYMGTKGQRAKTKT